MVNILFQLRIIDELLQQTGAKIGSEHGYVRFLLGHKSPVVVFNSFVFNAEFTPVHTDDKRVICTQTGPFQE
jgi:hypothetical protein